jgi:hypothetical protein
VAVEMPATDWKRVTADARWQASGSRRLRNVISIVRQAHLTLAEPLFGWKDGFSTAQFTNSSMKTNLAG